MEQNSWESSDDSRDKKRSQGELKLNYKHQMTVSCGSSEEKQSNGVTLTLCMSVFGAICGTGLVYGYNMAVINNPAMIMKKFFSEVRKDRTGVPLSTREINWYWSSCVAAICVLAPVGSYIGSRSARKFGRKKTLLANNVLLVLSSLMQAFSQYCKSYEMFLLGRFLLGLQTGIGNAVAPMYVSEVSPIQHRGAFGSFFQWFLGLGIVISSVLGFESLLGNEKYWPHLFTFLLVFAGVQVLVLSFCPESPQYLLISRRDTQAAMKSLEQLRGEKYCIKKDMEQMIEEYTESKKYTDVPYCDFFWKSSLRRPLLLSLAAVCSLQFSGVVAITMYSEPIFAAVVSTSKSSEQELAKHLVALLSIVRFITTSFSVPLVDKLGRRKCELTGLAGLIFCNTVLAFLLSDLQTGGQSCFGFPLSEKGRYIALVFIFLHSICFSVGVNTIAWLITPELFRTNARPKALFISTTGYWIANFLVSMGFDLIQNEICGWVFLIFSTLLIIFFFYFWCRLPVLDGKSVNEIAKMFETPSDHIGIQSQKLKPSKDSEKGSENEKMFLLEPPKVM